MISILKRLILFIYLYKRKILLIYSGCYKYLNNLMVKLRKKFLFWNWLFKKKEVEDFI